MGFELKNDHSKNSDMNYELWAKAHTDVPPSSTSRFMTMSAVLHTALILATALVSAPLIEQTKKETITIEIEDTKKQALGEIVAPTQGGQTPAPMPSLAAPAELPAQADDIVVPSAPKNSAPAASVAKKSVSKPATIKAASAPKQGISHSAKTALKNSSSSQVASGSKAVKIGPPAAAKVATIDDIDAPDIEQATQEMQHSWTATAYNDNIEHDLDKEKSKHNKVISAFKSKLDQEADEVDAENEAALAAADANSKAQAEAIAATNKARRIRDGQAIADAQARENAAAREAAAREAAAQRAAAAKAAAEKAALIAAANANQGQGNGTGHGKGEGTGNFGSANQGPASGVPNGVRSLDQLRQIPGNPVPQYSSEERLRRQQGQVTFHAYVNKDGSLTKFKQLSTTGYGNLDSKTLKALQNWKFYPGQEGWVELPFRWDLKGGAQSIDGLLRVKRSSL